MYEAVRHFRHFLEGREFHVFTDHKPLTHAMTQSGNIFTPRVSRQLAFVSEFTKDIRHVPRQDNAVMDALSRCATPPYGVHGHAPWAARLRGPGDVTSRRRRVASTVRRADSTPVGTSRHPPTRWPNSGVTCLAAPRAHSSLSNTASPYFYITTPSIILAYSASYRIINKRAVWPGMRRDSRDWTRACLACQAADTPAHPYTHSLRPLNASTPCTWIWWVL